MSSDTAGFIVDPPLTSGYAYRLYKPSIAELVDRHGIVCTEMGSGQQRCDFGR
jgi:hypothetical protein